MKPLTLIDKAFLLKRSTPFNALDLDLLLTIADKLTLLFFAEEEFIFFTGEEAARMFFIVKGSVKLEKELPSQITHRSVGDFFGEEALFNNKPRAYTAKASSPSYLFALSRANLYTIISECPSVAIGFLQLYTTLFPMRAKEEGESAP